MSVVVTVLAFLAIACALGVCVWETFRDRKVYRACLRARMSEDWPVRLPDYNEDTANPA